MGSAAGVLLGLLALVVVAWPLVRGRRSPSEAPRPDPLHELRRSRAAVFEEISSLEMEHELGQVETPEYEVRRRDHLVQAATLLQEEETLRKRASALDTTSDRDGPAPRGSLDGTSEDQTPPEEAR